MCSSKAEKHDTKSKRACKDKAGKDRAIGMEWT
jgi:hypothetical protein